MEMFTVSNSSQWVPSCTEPEVLPIVQNSKLPMNWSGRGVCLLRSSVRRALLLLAVAAVALALPAQTVQFTPAMTSAVTGLGHPVDVTFDKTGNMFIADSTNNLICRVDAVSSALTVFAGTGTSVCTTAGTTGYSGDAGPATSAELSSPYAVAVDSNENVYISDEANNRVRVVYGGGSAVACMIEIENPALFGLTAGSGTTATCSGATSAPVVGDIYTVLGPGVSPFTSGCINGNTATGDPCYMDFPSALALDSSGNVYVSNAHTSLITKLNVTTGVATRYAGTGTGGATAYEGGLANAAKMNNAYGIAVDATGGLYITDTKNYLIEYVNAAIPYTCAYGTAVTAAQDICVVAGAVNTSTGVGTEAANGTANLSPVSALSAEFDYVQRIGVDRNGNVLISDSNGDQVRSLNLTTGMISTVAGTGTAGNVLGAALQGQISSPLGVSADLSNNIYIADANNKVIRKVNASVDPAFPAIAVAAAGESQSFYALLTQADTVSSFQTPSSFKDFTSGTVAGCTLGSSSALGSVCAAPITFAPLGPGLRTAPLTLTDGSSSYTIGVVGTGNAPQLAVAPGDVSTFAGNGTAAYPGGTTPSTAEFAAPAATVVDGSGTVYIADAANNAIRKIQAGVVSTVAGTGSAGIGGDGGAATSAKLSNPTAVALDAAGDIYIADTGNNSIRVVYESGVALECLIILENPTSFGLLAGATSCTGAKSYPAAGDIYTIAGDGTSGFTGDGAIATGADLMGPDGVAVDTSGNVYIADTGNNRVRMVTASTGDIATIAGNGSVGFTNGTSALTAELDGPTALALDQSGDLYIADTANSAVRKLSLSGATITIVAGKGTSGYSGDGGAATSAALATPTGIALDAAGNLYIADTGNSRIRLVLSSSGTISTIAGNGSATYAGDGGEALIASFDQPKGVALDSTGRLYVADTVNNRIRFIDSTTSSFVFGTVNPGSSSLPLTATAVNIGNQALTLTGLTISTSFKQQASGGTDCTSTTTLTPGQSCNVEVIFDPSTTGNFTGDITFTDNSLNQSSGTQTVSLSGVSAVTPTSLSITGLPASVTAGTAKNITVSAVNGSTVATTFTDTVTFSSTDPKAVLPANYTYTSTDAGTHVFSVTFETAGTQSVTVTDTQNANLIGSESTTVTVAAPAALSIVSGNNQTAPTLGTFSLPLEVQILDTYGNPVSGVTVTFTAPTTGASGTFAGGSTTAQVSSNSSGDAISPVFTANTTSGTYSVTASAPALTAVGFSLTNSSIAVPAITLTASPVASPLVYGEGVLLTATLNPSTASGIAATGTITFYAACATQGAIAVGTGAVSSGKASFTYLVPPACAYSFTASYSGDSNFAANTTTAGVSLTVAQASSTLTGPTVTPVTVTVGQSSQVSISVAGQFSGINIVPPSGVLTYQIGTGTPATAPIQFGTATLSIPSTLAGGAYTIAVSYAGDNNYLTTSLSIPLSITFLTQTITFPAIPTSVTYGVSPITLSATASSNLAVVYTVSGPATIANSILTITGAGTVVVTATQPGNATYGAATPVAQTITVAKAPTQTALTVNPTSAAHGASVTLTATVSSILQPNGPTQTVTFYSGGVSLGSSPVNSSTGVATYSSTTLAAGVDSITAQYSGDTNYLGSTSAAQSVTIISPNFTFTLPASSFTVVSGQSVNTEVTLTGTGGYTGSVTFSCANLPLYASCAFVPNPQSLTAAAPVASIFLVIRTDTPNGAGLLLPIGILCALLFATRKKWNKISGMWLAGLMLAVGLGISGCGSGSNPSESPLNTPTGSTTFTVTATDGTITQSASYSLTVQ